MHDWSITPLVTRAAAVMAAGGVVAYATEAVWGLGVDPTNPRAIARLLQLKQRPRHKGLILLAADMKQLQPWLDPLPAEQRQRLSGADFTGGQGPVAGAFDLAVEPAVGVVVDDAAGRAHDDDA